MTFKCYLLSSREGLTNYFQQIATNLNLNFEFEKIQLNDLKARNHHKNCILFVDDLYISNDLIPIEILENYTWVLLTNQILVHSKTLNYPPIQYMHLGLPRSIISEKLKTLYGKLNLDNNSNVIENKILLSDMNRRKLYQNLNLLVYAEGLGDYARIFSIKEDYDISELHKAHIIHNLKYLEGVLPDSNFYRIHKSYIVNLDFTDNVQNFNQNIIRLRGGIELPIARRRKKELIEHINNISAN